MAYRTVAGLSESEVVEKKSRFLGYLSPAETEEKARDFVREISRRNHGARHNCFAYRIGTAPPVERAADDGEPQGTAGTPILAALRASGVTNAVLVVTRYFGGILLGTGGLCRAYGQAAKEALEAAEILEKIPMSRLRITLDYSLSQKVGPILERAGGRLESADYSERVVLLALVPPERREALKNAVTEATASKVVIEELGDVY